MESPAFDRLVLRKKKEKVLELVNRFCETHGLPEPVVNFDGCPYEGSSGPELAHYHFGEHRICISERQLQLHSDRLYNLEKTVSHEMAHFFIKEHGQQQAGQAHARQPDEGSLGWREHWSRRSNQRSDRSIHCGVAFHKLWHIEAGCTMICAYGQRTSK